MKHATTLFNTQNLSINYYLSFNSPSYFTSFNFTMFNFTMFNLTMFSLTMFNGLQSHSHVTCNISSTWACFLCWLWYISQTTTHTLPKQVNIKQSHLWFINHVHPDVSRVMFVNSQYILSLLYTSGGVWRGRNPASQHQGPN